MMRELSYSNNFISFTHSGDPPDNYILTYSCTGLIWDDTLNKPTKCKHFKVELVLHSKYPVLRPQLKMRSPIFHPNFYNSGICIGEDWNPGYRIDDICVQICRMIQYKNYGLTSVLNERARDWVKQNEHLLPIK